MRVTWVRPATMEEQTEERGMSRSTLQRRGGWEMRNGSRPRDAPRSRGQRVGAQATGRVEMCTDNLTVVMACTSHRVYPSTRPSAVQCDGIVPTFRIARAIGAAVCSRGKARRNCSQDT